MTIHHRLSVGSVVALLALLPACEAEPGEETRAAPGLDSTAIGEAVFEYDSAAFREIDWPREGLALERGRTVWEYSCQWCHGAGGQGKSGLVLRGDSFSTSSFREPEWDLAGRPWELRRRIFAGSELGMPHWGLQGLKRRDVDAVARYILRGLREGDR